jgi:ketosteroid isomerase-like protein
MMISWEKLPLKWRAAYAAAMWTPNRDWWDELLVAVDSGDAGRFVSFLTPDASFRFANADCVVGSEAIEVMVAGFFAAIASSRHELIQCWGVAPSVACEGTVTYTRRDGSRLRVPFVNAFDLHGRKIASYRIYIDNSALFGAH